MKMWLITKNILLRSLLSVSSLSQVAEGRGLLLLYRPRDISNDCVFSRQLRYDLSFGNGLSDTISLVFRTLSEIDYQCGVEIVTESTKVFLIVVIRFPNHIGKNCPMNANAFTVMKKNKCVRICDVIGDRDMNSPYFILTVRGRIRFQFLSNSSINADMEANLYQVTATAARQKPLKGCNLTNESMCVIDYNEYCFTSGVVCDGIKNCGVSDWFDERKSECELAVERIGHAPVVAVVSLVLFVVLAVGHLIMQYLPPLANSFFIFNANEDNRLCIDSVFKAPDYVPDEIDKAKRLSIIPIPSSSSEEQTVEEKLPGESEEQEFLQKDNYLSSPEQTGTTRDSDGDAALPARRKNTMRVMTDFLQQRLRAVTGRRRSQLPPDVL